MKVCDPIAGPFRGGHGRRNPAEPSNGRGLMAEFRPILGIDRLHAFALRATAKDNRLFLEAVLWRVRTGVPWRDLPSDFGHWNSVFQRFRRWVKGGVFARVFECLSDEPDFEYALVDGTIVPAHQKASGAKEIGRAHV